MKHRIAGMTGCYLLGLFLITGIFALASAFEDAKGYTADDCMECHRSEGGESALLISIENYNATVHSQSVTCLECHTGITDETHMEGEGVDRVNCSGCHEMKASKIGLLSIFSSSRIASHKKANFTNNYKMDNCLGCHQGTGMHGETQPINDQDCYKCHDPDINVMLGYMHTGTKQKALSVILMQTFFSIFILVALFGRFLVPVFNKFLGKNNKS